MNKEKTYQIISNSETCLIPSFFPLISNVDPSIYKNLIEKKQYSIKSNVRRDVLQYFLNNWITNEIPNITSDNIYEYHQLCEEFDRMKNLLQISKKILQKKASLQKKGSKLSQNLQDQHNKLTEKTEKYHSIIHILFENMTKCHSAFIENKMMILDACEHYDTRYVDLFTRKEIEQDKVSYIILDHEKLTVGVLNYVDIGNEIFIPKTIIFDSKEFTVTAICNFAFMEVKKLKSIIFADDSELKSIGESAFYGSGIESISIPKHVQSIADQAFAHCVHLKSVEFQFDSELESIGSRAFSWSEIKRLSIPSGISCLSEDVFENTPNLREVVVNRNENQNILCIDNSLIVTKSDLKSDFHDVLLFAPRNIRSVKIPSQIKRIAPFAFSKCNKLHNIEIEENSQLEIIDRYAFESSFIFTIDIPNQVKKIADFAFQNCEYLEYVKFSNCSKLTEIGKFAFSYSSLKNIEIPFHIKKLEVIKPSFSEDSELISIGKSAFFRSQINKIIIPSSVTKIKRNAFGYCLNLKSVEFGNESKLKSIGKYSFSHSSLERISFPSSVERLKKGLFLNTSKLVDVQIIQSSQQNFSYIDNSFIVDIFNSLIFARRNIKKAIIPSSIVEIAPYAFYGCKQLQDVIFSSHSKLKSIGSYAFSKSSLRIIQIPLHITLIEKFAFFECLQFCKIEFPAESELTKIGNFAFSNTSLTSFLIPKKVTEIGDCAFSDCQKLNIIELDENSEIKAVKLNSFYASSLKVAFFPPSKISVVHL